MVDFEQKNLSAQAERRKIRHEASDVGEAEEQKQSGVEDKEFVLDTQEQPPDNDNEYWSVINSIFASFCSEILYDVQSLPLIYSTVMILLKHRYKQYYHY